MSTTSTTCSRWLLRTSPSAAARPSDAEALIAGEVERFHQRLLTVNVAPAIVALQRQAEEIRQAEFKRAQARLGPLNAEQIAAVEALTRGLVNKFLHPPMQALKQAARENDAVRLEALCETWSLPAGATEQDAAAARNRASAGNPDTEEAQVSETSEAGRK